MKESDILFETATHWVSAASRFDGYTVWRIGATHSVACASIGYAGQVGLDKAIAEAKRRSAS